MKKSLRTTFTRMVEAIESRQAKRLIKRFCIQIECHEKNIRSSGIDAVQAFEIAGLMAGGGRVHAFGSGFVEVTNGLGELFTFHCGEQSNRSV